MTRPAAQPASRKLSYEPMKVERAGSVAELMRTTNTGSRRDGQQGCGGQNRRRQNTGGTPCGA